MWWYNFGIRCYSGAIGAASVFNRKAKLWKRGRKDIFERLRDAFDQNNRPIVWIHAASLGEFEQGRPVIEAVRRTSPQYRILVTFFSPSGYEVRKNYDGADWVFYLPSDTKRNARRFLDIVNPEVAIFVKYEFWLNYLTELGRRRTRTFIVSAIFRRDSIFFRSYGKAFRKALTCFERLFVQDNDSKELLVEIGLTESVIVAGDTRFDRVADIARAAKRLPEIERFIGGSEVFVAGSTWGEDEEILQHLINENPTIKFILAPHEMDEDRIESLIRNTAAGAVRYTGYTGEKSSVTDAQLLIIDTIGLLSSIYRYARYAYIGGGFGAGIHNTLEAVTYGLPIAFGPNYSKFREARDLTALGVATPVESFDDLKEWFGSVSADTEKYERLRDTALGYIESHTGATRIIIKHIFE